MNVLTLSLSLGTGGHLLAQTNALRMSQEVISASANAPVELVVTLEHDLPQLGGFGFSLVPAAPLAFSFVAYAGPLPDPQVDFVDTALIPGVGARVGVIFSTGMLVTIPAGTYPVVRVGVDAGALLAGQSRLVEFTSSVGTPPAVIEFFGPGIVIPEGQIQLTHGVVQRSLPPPPAEIGSTLWIPLSGQGSVARVDIPSASLVGTFSGPAGLSNPGAVAVDPTGAAWVLYEGSGTIIRYVPTAAGGTFIAPPIVVGGAPSAIAFDTAASAWVADRAARTLSKIGDGGTVLIGAGAATGPVVLTGEPLELAVDLTNSLWAATRSPATLTRVSPVGTVALEVPLSGDPGGLAIDRQGFLWVSFPSLDRVEVRASDGTVVGCWILPAGSSPTHLAIRANPAVEGGREAWVAGLGGAANGGCWRLRFDDMLAASCRLPSFFTLGLTAAPTGVTIDGLGRVWGSDLATGNLAGFDPATATPLSIPGLGMQPRFVGDASGYVQANLLHPGDRALSPFVDLDGDGFANAVELQAGSDAFDDASLPPPGFVPPVALVACTVASSQSTITVGWLNGLPSYDAIRVERIDALGGVVVIAAALPGNATTVVDPGVLAGTYRYVITPSVATVQGAPRECVITIGGGQRIAVHQVALGPVAPNLSDIAQVPGADPTDPDAIVFYATDAASGVIYALNGDFQVLGTLPNPLAQIVTTVTGVAIDPDGDSGGPSILVAGGGLGEQVRVREVRRTGELLTEWLITENGLPAMGIPGGMAYAADTDHLLLIGPIGCDVFAFSRASSGAVDPVLSFPPPVLGPARNGIDIPPGHTYGPSGGRVALTTAAQSPTLPDAQVEYAITTFEFLTAGAPPIVVEVLPLTSLDAETALGGFAFGPRLGVIGITSSSIHELFLPRTFRRGDCTADGAVNLTDAVQVLRIVFLGDTSPCLAACNIHDDGSLNLVDAIALLNYLFLSGPEPAAPFPMCGLDPTPTLAPSCTSFAPCP